MPIFRKCIGSAKQVRLRLTSLVVATIILTNFVSLGSYVPETQASMTTDPATFWNEAAIELTEKAKLPPVRTARALALTHVAIYDALLAAQDGHSSEAPLRAVAAGAASEVLMFLYPGDKAMMKEKEAGQVMLGQGKDLGTVISGQKFGHAV